MEDWGRVAPLVTDSWPVTGIIIEDVIDIIIRIMFVSVTIFHDWPSLSTLP
jgi:hypothetical protein